MRSGLLAGLLAACLLATGGSSLASPEWIVDPSSPGPDRPQSGESRFDQLFRNPDGSYAIPYPVDALIDYLDSRLDNGSRSGLRRILIPLGRSLQREAPAPDYFRFPRQVLATEGEPLGEFASEGLVMEYRLFIAHQPKTESLEIISYNDATGRFEFQVIEGYGAAGEPRARPVSRAMCMSCHHNGAPIFSRNPWSETSFNLPVARHLAAALPDRYGSAIEILTVDADVIDVLTERANYLSAAQLLWQRACASRACRVAMLRALLQYRLSGRADFDRTSDSYRADYVAEIQRSWERYWPGGLALPGSRIPDRDPFSMPVVGELDPLSPRPAQAIWREVDASLADGIVTRLAGFLTRDDLRRIDGRLRQLAAERKLQARKYRAECSTAYRDVGILGLACGEPGNSDTPHARIEIEQDAAGVTEIGVVALQLPRNPNLLQPRTGKPVVSNDRLSVQLGPQPDGLSARLYNGLRLTQLNLEWDSVRSAPGSILEVETVDDFQYLETALQTMYEQNPVAGADPLGRPVFQRDAVMQALGDALGMPARVKTAQTGGVLPQSSAPEIAALEGGLALLEPYCAHCHADRSRHPPGFLFSSDPLEAIVGCAPRMLARLRAWNSNDSARPTPMPPPLSLGLSGSRADEWPASEHFASLVESLEELIGRHHGQAAVTRFADADYAGLPACTVNFSE